MQVHTPTIATEAIMLLYIINAKEERHVAIINIPNTFIHMQVEDEDDMAIIKISGVLVDIHVQIVYKSYIMTDKKGMKQSLIQCQNALYGWYNGCKPTVLSQIHQESGECWIQNQSIQSVCSKQDCQQCTNDSMLSHGCMTAN
jgi:hypothetical protein